MAVLGESKDEQRIRERGGSRRSLRKATGCQTRQISRLHKCITTLMHMGVKSLAFDVLAKLSGVIKKQRAVHPATARCQNVIT